MEVLEALIGSFKSSFENLTDKRKNTRNNIAYSIEDIAMAGFSLFFTQSESFLSWQRNLEVGFNRSNCQSLFKMNKIPTDSHIRSVLDEISPDELKACFDDLSQELISSSGGLKTFKVLGGHIPIALDGTEYFCSQKIGCKHCLERKRSNEVVEKYHSMLSATIVCPSTSVAIPFFPEFIYSEDGTEKQDCEINAAKRWISANNEKVSELNPIFLGDALFSCGPMITQVKNNGNSFVFVSKPQRNKSLYKYLETAPITTMIIRTKTKETHSYSFANNVPLKADGDLMVNWAQLIITDEDNNVKYKNAFITDLDVDQNNVREIIKVGRSRWKIENESFNVLKNHGYNLEHNFGHGKNYLGMVFATLNLLAFGAHGLCDVIKGIWAKARLSNSRKGFFKALNGATTYLIFPDWETLLETVITGFAPPHCYPNYTAPT